MGGEGQIYWQSLGRRPNISVGKYATLLQAEICAILLCVREIHMDITPGKYISICSDNQAALKALEATNTTSPLVHTTVPKGVDIST